METKAKYETPLVRVINVEEACIICTSSDSFSVSNAFSGNEESEW